MVQVELQPRGTRRRTNSRRWRSGSHIFSSTALRFEIALWTSKQRLPSWRDKPEPQAIGKGGLKRAPVASSSPAKNDKTPDEATDVEYAEDTKERSAKDPISAESGEKTPSVTRGSIDREEELFRAIISRPPEVTLSVEIDRCSSFQMMAYPV